MKYIIRQLTSFIIIAFLFTGCNSIVLVPPPPTPITLRFAYTPILRPWVESLVSCTKDQPEVALFLFELPADQLNLSDYDAILRLGGQTDPDEIAIVVGYEELKVIVNGLNPVSSIDEGTLIDLFDGSLVTWETLSPPNAIYVVSVKPFIYPPGSELSAMAILNETKEFQPAPIARFASDPGQVIQGVKDEEGGIGVVPVSWLIPDPENVKTIDMPITPTLPILAIAKSEPQGPLRQILGCVSKL